MGFRPADVVDVLPPLTRRRSGDSSSDRCSDREMRAKCEVRSAKYGTKIVRGVRLLRGRCEVRSTGQEGDGRALGSDVV